jgi:hypothetical protein
MTLASDWAAYRAWRRLPFATRRSIVRAARRGEAPTDPTVRQTAYAWSTIGLRRSYPELLTAVVVLGLVDAIGEAASGWARTWALAIVGPGAVLLFKTDSATTVRPAMLKAMVDSAGPQAPARTTVPAAHTHAAKVAAVVVFGTVILGDLIAFLAADGPGGPSYLFVICMFGYIALIGEQGILVEPDRSLPALVLDEKTVTVGHLGVALRWGQIAAVEPTPSFTKRTRRGKEVWNKVGPGVGLKFVVRDPDEVLAEAQPPGRRTAKHLKRMLTAYSAITVSGEAIQADLATVICAARDHLAAYGGEEDAS